MDESVRWSLKVSRETDKALRAYLGLTGGRKGDLSRFVQEAVEARLEQALRGRGRRSRRAGARAGVAEAVEEIRSSTKALSKSRFEKLVTEAVAFARKRR